MSSFCTWKEQGGVFHLMLAGDDDHHYLTKEALDELCRTLAKIREQATAKTGRGLITTSSSGSFCDGVDYSRASPSHAKAAADGMATVIRELLAMPMLTVCAATGNASSLGLALALAHDDFVVLSDGYYQLGMVEKGVAVPPHVGALIREKTDRWYTLTTLKSRWRTGNWMTKWYFADKEAGNRMDVLMEAEKLVDAWTGDGEAHADMRRQLCRETWEAVNGEDRG